MNHKLPDEHPQERRRREARDRLHAAFDPQTDGQKRMITWLLGNLIPNEMDLWSEMVERVAKRARADGYERGWRERGEQS